MEGFGGDARHGGAFSDTSDHDRAGANHRPSTDRGNAGHDRAAHPEKCTLANLGRRADVDAIGDECTPPDAGMVADVGAHADHYVVLDCGKRHDDRAREHVYSVSQRCAGTDDRARMYVGGGHQAKALGLSQDPDAQAVVPERCHDGPDSLLFQQRQVRDGSQDFEPDVLAPLLRRVIIEKAHQAKCRGLRKVCRVDLPVGSCADEDRLHVVHPPPERVCRRSASGPWTASRFCLSAWPYRGFVSLSR
jgi:hypothetical protein